ncbi:putative 28S rRNA (cytosine-C(5))-methyltransferase [Holothuria leucospilota]|uniref:28S rRNA (Cytosine-C(5))-methyltransferase n=1 Tax=Holothuria leucospilota TaxID=206669 RepID=A0A9Q1BL26_HOLLE|nr:putative 28S rRNA (cytosine-C(5))-methyltransferase [Holothuria leucospilota]
MVTGNRNIDNLLSWKPTHLSAEYTYVAVFKEIRSMALVGQRLLNAGLPVETRHSYSSPRQFKKNLLDSPGNLSQFINMENGTSMSESAIDSLAEKLDSDTSEVDHVIYHYSGLLFGSLSPGFKSDRFLVDKHAETEHSPVMIPIRNESVKKQIYDLAFSTLKYQALLEEILVDSGYYSYDMIPDENHHPVMVILCDMMQRHFVKRRSNSTESLIPYIQELEDDLHKHNIKLNAALARNRIKFQARSIEHLLPAKVRERDECGVQLPTYAWINQLRNSIPEAMDSLREHGFSRVSSLDRLHEDNFVQDENCTDVIAFPPGSKERLEESDLVKDGFVVIQDKICCIGPHSVTPMLSDGDDVIHVGVTSGLTTAHLATLTNSSNSHIYAFGVRDSDHLEQLQGKMTHLGISNVKFLMEDFAEIQQTDSRFKNVKVVLVTPPDSRSGLLNPVEFIIQEGEDLSILTQMSQESINEEKVNSLVVNQMDMMKNAMKLPKVQAVVYSTLSVLEEENEGVVTKAVEYTNIRTPGTKNPYKIIPPTIPLTPKDLECHQQSSKFLKIAPSSAMGGCFVAVVSRQDEAMNASDILARAAAKGLYSLGVGEDQQPGDDSTEDIGERKVKRKSPRGKQKSVQKLIRSSKSSHTTEGSHGHNSHRKATSPTRKQARKTKPARTAKKAGHGSLSKTKFASWQEFSNSHSKLLRSTPVIGSGP